MRTSRKSAGPGHSSGGSGRARPGDGSNGRGPSTRADLCNLLALAPDAMAVVDADGLIACANPQAEELFGYAANELDGGPVELLVPEGGRDLYRDHADPGVRAMHRTLVLGGLRRDGSAFPVEIALTPFDGSEERLVVATIRDVTSRTQAEVALHEAGKRFRVLFENAPIGAALVATPPSNRFLAVNKAFSELVGYTEDELLRLEWRAITDPKDLPGNDQLATRMASGEIASFEVEKRYIHKDGHPVWALVTSALVRDDAGEPLYGVTQMLDITERRLAREDLRRSRALLAEAERLTHVGSWEWDPETNTSVWTDELYNIWELDPTTRLTFDAILERVHPDDREAARQAVETALETGRAYEFDHRMVRRSGEVRWMHVKGEVALDAGARMVRGTCQDVTEQRLAHDELRRSEERLSEAQKLASLGSWEWDFETDALTWSAELCRILGVDPADRPATYHEYLDRLPPERREWLDTRLAESRRTSEPFENEHEIVGLDGVRRWIHTRGEIVTASDGRRLMRGTTQDVTARRQTEERLREAELRYRTLVEQLPLVTYIRPIDLSQPNLYCSPQVEPILGYSSEEWQTNPDLLGQIVHPDDREYVLAEAERVRSTGEPFRGEYRYVARDGRVVWVQDESYIVRDDHGEPLVQGYLLDVTERKLAEEERDRLRDELHHAQRLDEIGRLAGGVAHDFNNMLTAIKGYGELLLQGLGLDSPLRNEAEQIRRAAEQASELPKKLLAFSRKQPAEPTLIDLNAKVEEARALFGRVIGETIDLVAMPDARPALILADPGQIEQVFLNLVVNSRDAMPSGGALTISTRNIEWGASEAATNDVRPGQYVVLTVSDSGQGMNEETRARAFEPFFTTKSAGRGSGLGLAIVHGIVREAGGFMRIESEVDRGTTIELFFPLAVASAGHLDGRGAHDATAGTVLLVEDEVVVRELAVTVLERAGYRVLVASNGGEAIATCERDDQPIDVLVTDIVMPGMTGNELAEKVLRLRPGVEVVFMSGYAEEGPLVSSGRGVDGAFLQKPFSPGRLVDAVQAATGRPTDDAVRADDDPSHGQAAVVALTRALTCLVADDHPAVLDSVSRFLEGNGVIVVARAARGDTALEEIEALRPAVALLDIGMQPLSGIEVARRVRASTPESRIVLYTGLRDRALLERSLDAGASGFVLKESPLPELVRALDVVAGGGTYVDPELSGAIASGELQAPRPR